MAKKNIDWGNLTFSYTETDYSYVSMYENGEWDEGTLTPDHTITMSECACVLQYAQTCIEGLKAYTTADGRIVCFRPDLNAKRILVRDSDDVFLLECEAPPGYCMSVCSYKEKNGPVITKY